jgi:hypothetical protein
MIEHLFFDLSTSQVKGVHKHVKLNAAKYQAPFGVVLDRVSEGWIRKFLVVREHYRGYVMFMYAPGSLLRNVGTLATVIVTRRCMIVEVDLEPAPSAGLRTLGEFSCEVAYLTHAQPFP